MQIHDGGTSAGLAGQFEMTADAVRDIANRAMESTRSRTERKAHDFGDIEGPRIPQSGPPPQSAPPRFPAPPRGGSIRPPTV